jgi:hypothetical protein
MKLIALKIPFIILTSLLFLDPCLFFILRKYVRWGKKKSDNDASFC